MTGFHSPEFHTQKHTKGPQSSVADPHCIDADPDPAFPLDRVPDLRVRRGTIRSAPACCKAGPSSNLGSAPQRRPSTERKR